VVAFDCSTDYQHSRNSCSKVNLNNGDLCVLALERPEQFVMERRRFEARQVAEEVVYSRGVRVDNSWVVRMEVFGCKVNLADSIWEDNKDNTVPDAKELVGVDDVVRNSCKADMRVGNAFVDDAMADVEDRNDMVVLELSHLLEKSPCFSTRERESESENGETQKNER
jgi:hypothetical protein